MKLLYQMNLPTVRQNEFVTYFLKTDRESGDDIAGHECHISTMPVF